MAQRRRQAQTANAILNERSSALAPVAARLKAWAERENLTKSLPGFYANVIHMHCNRLLGRDRAMESKTLGLFFRTREGLAHTVGEQRTTAGSS